MNSMQKKCLVTVISAIVCGKAIAQTPASIDVGGFDLYPSLNAEFGHDDNVIRSNDSEIESWKSTIAPELILVNSYGLNEVQVGYRLERGDYFSSNVDDYTDHLFNALGKFEFNVRNRLEVLAIYTDEHDERGTNFSIGRGELLESPDTYKSYKFDATYSYGALTSTGRLDLNVGYSDTDYDINTPIYRSRDRDTTTLGGTFYYNVMPATDMTFDIIYNDINYDFALDPTAPLDSEELRLLVGVEWDTTAKTTGYIKVGHRQKEFDAGNREDFSGLDWKVGVIWTPRTYSTVDFSTYANTSETNGEGDFIDTQTFQVKWDHEWLDRVSTTVNLTYSQDDYTGANSTRVDDNTTATFSINYQAQRYLAFQAGYTFDQRDSNQNVIDFDRNIVTFTVDVTL